MAFDPDKVYYKNLEPTSGRPGPFTPRELSSIPSKKIHIMYRDADGISVGELDVKIVWVDDSAIYLERKAEDDFMVPWHDVFFIEPVNSV